MTRGIIPSDDRDSVNHSSGMRSWYMAVMTQAIMPGEKHSVKITPEVLCEQPSLIRPGSRWIRRALSWASQSYLPVDSIGPG